MRRSVIFILTIATAVCRAGETAPRVARPWGIVFTEVPAGTPTTASGFFRTVAGSAAGEGGRLILLESNGATKNLTPEFESAADPAVSFDAKRILFAGRRTASDRWDIYEMMSDGSAVRQITHGPGNSRFPIYQSPVFYLDDPEPLPQIAFVSDAPAELGEYEGIRATAIYSARLDGSGIRRLTYVPSGAFGPAMLPDGRMVFSAARGRTDAKSRPGAALFGINIDGTDFAAFSGDQGGRLLHMACVTSKNQVVFVEAAAPDGSGSLAAIDLRRNLHSRRSITAPSAGMFHSPSSLPDGAVLVSHRPLPNARYSLRRLDLATGKTELIFSQPGSHLLQAHALVPRPTPDGRSSVVDENQIWAKLYCLNIYETDLDAKVWPKGTVSRIRILEGLPRSASDRKVPSLLLQKRLVGEVDVDDDGSFNVEFPANLPVQIQALDRDGMALRTSGWIWAKNKEQRGCIGCHEDGERTPANIMATALTRPPANLVLAPERRRTVEFERDVAPILQQKCANRACHGGTSAPSLSHRTSNLVTPGRARTSPLIWAIFGRNTSRPWDTVASRPIKTMPPPGASPLTESEKRTIVEWIDFGAHYGTGETGAGR
jgi:hypothetical protein